MYKPFAIYDGKQWLLLVSTVAREASRQIGLAFHPGEDLGF